MCTDKVDQFGIWRKIKINVLSIPFLLPSSSSFCCCSGFDFQLSCAMFDCCCLLHLSVDATTQIKSTSNDNDESAERDDAHVYSLFFSVEVAVAAAAAAAAQRQATTRRKKKRWSWRQETLLFFVTGHATSTVHPRVHTHISIRESYIPCSSSSSSKLYYYIFCYLKKKKKWKEWRICKSVSDNSRRVDI